MQSFLAAHRRQAGCAKEPGLLSVACHLGVRSLLAWARAAPYSLGIKVGRVKPVWPGCWRARFIKPASINGIESELVYKPHYGLLCVLVIAGHGQAIRPWLPAGRPRSNRCCA